MPLFGFFATRSLALPGFVLRKRQALHPGPAPYERCRQSVWVLKKAPRNGVCERYLQRLSRIADLGRSAPAAAGISEKKWRLTGFLLMLICKKRCYQVTPEFHYENTSNLHNFTSAGDG